MGSNHIVAAGGIVWRKGKAGAETLLVHRPSYDDWAFAKGKVDQHESLREAARREVTEETGLTTTLGPYLGYLEYVTDAGNDKRVHYWAMKAVGGSFKPNHEVDKIKWLPMDRAAEKMSYKRDRMFFLGLGDKWWRPHRQVLLLRHAYAGRSATWTGDDAKRPLSVRGKEQTIQLAESFADLGIQRIVSSPADRCVQTVEPLAAAIGLEVETSKALAEGADIDDTVALLRKLAKKQSVAVTHGDVIFDVLEYLGASGTALPPLINAKKGSTWVLEPDEHRNFVSGTYWPPPPNPRRNR